MPPAITTLTLPNAVAGTAYSQQLAFTGGNSTTGTWSLVSGALPGGLSLSAGGLISGTPTNASAGATTSFSVSVAVGAQTSVATPLQITVLALPSITTAALPSGNVSIPYSQQLTYTGGAGGAVSWAIVSGALPSSSGLTLSTNGLISGTPALATSYTFSVAVTVGTQTSAPQAYTLLINNLIVTSSASASGEAGLPFSFNLTARGGTPPYTWSLTNTSASLPAGLNLNPATGAITGSPTATAGSPFGNIIVKATDQVGGTATQTMTFTISAARSGVNDSELFGQYAFLLSGFDAKGNPLAAAGKFTSDGNGNITGGTIDTNGTGLTAPVSASLTGGTYAVGPDNRGKLTLTTASGSSTYVLALNSIASGVAAGGYITEFDGSGQSLTGTLAQQIQSAFNTSSIVNGFAFGTDGFAANSTAAQLAHRATAGEVQFGGGGAVTSAEYLSTGSGSTKPIVPTSGSISVASNGRGTLSLSLSGGGSLNFVAYVVSASKLLLLSSDPASGASGKDLLSGQALLQTTTNGSFAAALLNGISVVRFERLGSTTAGTTFPDAQVGLYTFDGASKISLASDENAGGVITSNSLAGSYSVASNGRVTLSLSAGFGGCTDCVSVQTFFYLVGANQGFVMDFSSPVVSGYFEPQTSTGLSLASLSGAYASGTLDPLAQSGAYYSGVFTSTGTGSLSGTEDENVDGTLSPDAAVSASYSAGSTGRVAVTYPGGASSAIYIISPTKTLSIGLTNGLAPSNPIIQELLH
jgi:hypothetical protein